MLQRNIIFMLVAVWFLPQSSLAAEGRARVVQPMVLSMTEVVRLKPAQRQLYLDGIAEIFMAIESEDADGEFINLMAATEDSDLIKLGDLILPKASAQDNSLGSASSPGATTSATAAGAETTTPSSSPTPAVSCVAFEDQNCRSRKKRKKALKKYAAAGGNVCISGGSLSEFPEGKAKKGRCQRVSQLQMAGKVYDCGQRTLCHPLIFGTRSETEPICTRENVRSCHRIAQQLAKKGSPYVPASQLFETQDPDVREHWNKLVDGLNSLCRQSAAGDADEDINWGAVYHCKRCNILRTRLVQLGAKIYPSTCGVPNSKSSTTPIGAGSK